MKRALPQIGTLLLLLALFGCKDKAPRAGSSSKSATSDPPSPLTPATDTSSVPIAAPNPEQSGSAVRVRVFGGGLPVRNYTGAILHRDALKEVTGMSDKYRVVMTVLKGWTDEQLHSAESRFLVFRNLPDRKGEPEGRAYEGHLARFDPRSGIALITYYQKFPSTSDIGFLVRPSAKAPKTGIALRFRSQVGAKEPEPQSFDPDELGRGVTVPTHPPIPLLSAPFRLVQGRSKLVEFADADSGPMSDDASLVTNIPAVLDGFVSFGDDGVETFVPAPALAGMISLGPQVNFKAAAFSQENYLVKVNFEVELKHGGRWPSELFLGLANLPSGTSFDLQETKAPFEPIADFKGNISLRPAPDQQHRSWGLNSPTRDGEERVYLLQLGWKADPAEKEPSLFSRPAVVKLTRNAAGVTAITQGILNLNEANARAPARPASSQKLEAIPVEAYPIAGGREVLIQFKSEPFWKRYSMEKGEWLPLPDLNLSNVILAGDRSSLYALDRAAGEIRKYALADLALGVTARLDPVGEQFMMIRAGCNTVAAPLHIISKEGPVSLDPNSLSRKDLASNRSPFGTDLSDGSHLATGDGISLVSRTSSLTYGGDWVGLARRYFDYGDLTVPGAMVSAAFAIKDRAFVSRANVDGLAESFPLPRKHDGQSEYFEFPNVPIFAQYIPGATSVIPPEPSRLRLHPFFATEPIADVEAPELAGYRDYVETDGLPSHQICYDSYSGKVAVLGRSDSSWTIHEVRPDGKQTVPVLLNWPDTCVLRNAEFKFDALLTGEAKITAELIGPKEPTPVTVDNRTVSFRVAEKELASLLLLKLTLSGANGNLTYPIPIHVQGLQNPIISSELNAERKAEDFTGSSFKSLAVTKQDHKVLTSSVLRMSNPVTEILAPTAGHVGLVTARSVEIVSLATREIVSSIPVAEKVKYYAGCGALFEFDANSRTLTRINIPDGRRGPAFSLPPKVDLQSIALGSDRGQPLTLVLDSRRASINPGFPGTGPQKFFATTVLNGETLAPMGWDAPQGWAMNPNVGPLDSAFQMLSFGHEFPKQLAASRNGALVVLPLHLLVQTPRYSILAPYPNAKLTPWGPYNGPYNSRPTGSITGLIAASNNGIVFRNGLVDDPHEQRIVSPCGRYEFVRNDIFSVSSYEVRTLEGRRPLFRIHRIAALKADAESVPGVDNVTSRFLWDNGALVIVSRNGRLVQLIDLDIGPLAQEANPSLFHVTSQPMPCVVEGGAFEYQIQVNNPAAVSSFKLRSPNSGASLSPNGSLRFSPPQNVRFPTQVDFSVEIQGKYGNKVLHDFPLLVLPKRVTSLPATPAPGSRRL